MRFLTYIFISSICFASSLHSADTVAKEILKHAEITVSLCAMPRIGDGSLAMALQQSGAGMIYGLAQTEQQLHQVRKATHATGLLGRDIMVDIGKPTNVPLANWTADLVLIADANDNNIKDISADEIWRLLSPYRGIALIGNSENTISKTTLEAFAKTFPIHIEQRIIQDSSGTWLRLRRPADSGMDEWTHFLHDADNNPVSNDSVLKPPYKVQYISPPFTGVGGGCRFAGGVLYEVQGLQHKHGGTAGLKGQIWARNAYNGELLWQGQLPANVDAKRNNFVANSDTFYLVGHDHAAVICLDSETGNELNRISLGTANEQCKWIAIHNGMLLALIGPQGVDWPEKQTYHGRNTELGLMKKGKINHGYRVCAFNLKTQKKHWEKSFKPYTIDPRATAAWDGKIVFLLENPSYEESSKVDELVRGKALVCLDLVDGSEAWRNQDKSLGNLKRRYQFIFGREFVPALIASKAGLRLRMIGIYENDILCFDPDSGETRWKWINNKETRVPGSFNGFFLENSYIHSKGIYDSVTGNLTGRINTWDGGCGIRSHAPNAGVFGNGNSSSIGMSVKSDCHQGTVPAGGLVTVPRGWCDCSGVWRGSMSFASRGDIQVHGDIIGDPKLRLEQHDVEITPLPTDERDWSVYRYNNKRSAASPVKIQKTADLLWHHNIQHPLQFSSQYNQFIMKRQDQTTEPIAAYGLVFYGASNGHLKAINATTGAVTWENWVGGSLYAAPSIWNGRIFVGSMDGFIYCFDAKTGALAWRFQASLREERILKAGHLISRWPIQGGVIINNGILYAAATLTKSNGVHIYALNAENGHLIWHNGELGQKSDQELIQEKTPAGFMTIFGNTLFVKTRNHFIERFDLMTGKRMMLPDVRRQPRKMRWDKGIGDTGREIGVIGNGLILSGGRSFEHEMNQREGDRGHQGFSLVPFKENGELECRLRMTITGPAIIPPAWDDEGLIMVPGGYGRYIENGKRYQSPKPVGTYGLLQLNLPLLLKQIRTSIESEDQDKWQKDSKAALSVLFNHKKAQAYGENHVNTARAYSKSNFMDWRFADEHIQVNAVVLAKNCAVLIREYKQLIDNKPPKYHWSVIACDRVDGSPLWEVTLPSEPTLNGLCIDRDGHIIVSLRDGGLVCIGNKESHISSDSD